MSLLVLQAISELNYFIFNLFFIKCFEFSFFSYGKFSLRKLDFPKARDLLKNAYEIYTDVHEKENPEVVDLLNNLAVACTNVRFAFS